MNGPEVIPLQPAHVTLDTNRTQADHVQHWLEGCGRSQQMISDQVMIYYSYIFLLGINGPINVFGIIGNVINIAVFIHQGVFKDNGTLTLTCLAVADGLSLLAGLALYLASGIPLPAHGWDRHTSVAIVGWPKVVLGFIVRAITTFMSFERCMCVMFPFKVKTIFTRSCSLTTIITMCVVLTVSHIPIWAHVLILPTIDPDTNSTYYRSITIAPYKTIIYIILYIVNQFGLGFVSVLIVLVCTTLMVLKMQQSSQWRSSNASTSTAKPTDLHSSVSRNADTHAEGKNEDKSSMGKIHKERKMVRIVTTISAIFIVCYIPMIVLMVLTSVNPDIEVKAKESNLAFLLYSVAFSVDSLNSSVNIFVYYRLSSRYKKHFRILFRLDQP